MSKRKCAVCKRLDEEIKRLNDLKTTFRERWDDSSKLNNMVSTNLLILERIRDGEKEESK